MEKPDITNVHIQRAEAFMRGQTIPGRNAGVQEMTWCADMENARRVLTTLDAFRFDAALWLIDLEKVFLEARADAQIVETYDTFKNVLDEMKGLIDSFKSKHEDVEQEDVE